MAHRRISSAEKGKGIDLGSQQPARLARVKAPLPDNTDLIRKHSLTLIGRVTNKSAQKVWSLIPFFTEHWKTEFKPVGSELGNGMFQFQFEKESDLLTVLEQRPYHYARWLIILQRWEPTISPTFPSLIPFWIKVQGLPLHLWQEPIVESIGRNIGLYEKAEITSLSVRMRVHVNGLLPLITNSVVEFPNGDEVATTLVYERLDKHCTKCLRLDHELKECLVARAENRAAKAKAEISTHPSESMRGFSPIPAQTKQREGHQDNRSQADFQFSATNRDRESGPPKEHRDIPRQRAYKPISKTWHEKSSYRRSQQSQERSRYNQEKDTRPYRGESYRNQPYPSSRGHYREVQKVGAEIREAASSASKSHPVRTIEGNPSHLSAVESTPRDACGPSKEDSREVRLQITINPTQGVEEGRRIESLRASDQNSTPERLPASQRLGTARELPTNSSSRERIPAKDRLGDNSTSPKTTPRLPATLRLGETSKSPQANTRLPATQRLGEAMQEEPREVTKEPVKAKRKPDRPPGSKKIISSPSLSQGGTSKRRKVSSKPTVCRRRLHPEDSRKGVRKIKDNSAKPTGSSGTHSSDNLPIVRMIPKVTRKKTGFRIPSDPVP